MKFSEIDFATASVYLSCASTDDTNEVGIYISSAKSYVQAYTALTIEELDLNEYFVMPTLMLIASFYDNKSVEMTGKLNSIYANLLNLGKVHSL